MIVNCNECKLEERNVICGEIRNWKGSILVCYSDPVLTEKSRNGTINGLTEIVIGGRENRTFRCSSYRYKQVEQNYVREIRSISYDHSMDLIVLETGMRRRAMKRRLRESAGMEPVVAYGFGSGSSNFVRRVPQGSFSRLRRRLLLALFGFRFRWQGRARPTYSCPRDLIIVNYSGH